MTTKHTPGPWTIDARGDVVASTDFLIAKTVKYVDRCDEANAHIIAAAPDLLAACEALACSFDAVAYAAWTPEMYAAVAAIAKAKGEDSGKA